ncbi:MAG: MBL fold metallo-hydrolase [Planctomycetota bacterium]|nr:MAG: MBL fold metallo-hydrolase [Planctomycetota bacterium]
MRISIGYLAIASIIMGLFCEVGIYGELPALDRSKPNYRIYPLLNGMCKIAGDHAFDGGSSNETYDYALYVWLILGGEKPILVEAGLHNVAEMNRGAAKVLRKPVTQTPQQSSRAQLRKFGLEPEEIGHVFITHLHFDHIDELLSYTNATIHIGRKEWKLATANDCRGSWGHGPILFKLRDDPAWSKRLHLIEDEEVLPGFESFWVGGHTPGSMAFLVNSTHGRVVLTSDTVSLLSNMDKPIGVYSDLKEVEAAIKTIRGKADIVLPSHDPGTLDRWPPVPAGTPKYTIRAIKVGQCEVRNHITFHECESQATRIYYLYVWVIQGGPRPMIVETGPNPKYIEEFNRATASYIPGGVQQLPEEQVPVVLKRAGIDPDSVSHVFITHVHADHYDYFPLFTNAKLVVNRQEWEDAKGRINPEVLKVVQSRPDALQLVENEEVVPGVRTVLLGCHTTGSQGVLVQTCIGSVMLTGDVVYMYDNIEKNIAINSPNQEVCLGAMAEIRSLADIVLPAHDPLTLERWPKGVIGGKTSISYSCRSRLDSRPTTSPSL